MRSKSIAGAIITVGLILTSCSSTTGCDNVRNIASQIGDTLNKIVSNPGNSYNSELATEIQLLSKINGSSEVKNSAQKLILNIESLMTSLNSADMASAGKAVSAMTTSIQILTSVCEA